MRIDNPFTFNIPVTTYVGYAPQVPPASSENGTSQATAIQGGTETRPSGPARGSSDESGMPAELNHLLEIERLKDEVKRLRVERVENQRLKNDVVQLTRLLEDERRKAQQKDEKLARLHERVKDLECQDLMANEYQAATARTRHHYAKDLQEKDNIIEDWEQRYRILEENNQRLQSTVEELESKTKDAQAHIRYSRIKNHIVELENRVEDLRRRRDSVTKQLSQVDDNRKDDLYDDLTSINKELKEKKAQLLKQRVDFKNMPNPDNMAGDIGPHSRSGSYDTQYDPMPELVPDRSSHASGSPPQSESQETMDGYLINSGIPFRQSIPNADPWAKTVEPSTGSSPRASEHFAIPVKKHKKDSCR